MVLYWIKMRVPGTQQLTPFKIGEDNLKLETKNCKKIKSFNMVKQKVVIRFFRHAD